MKLLVKLFSLTVICLVLFSALVSCEKKAEETVIDNTQVFDAAGEAPADDAAAGAAAGAAE